MKPWQSPEETSRAFAIQYSLDSHTFELVEFSVPGASIARVCFRHYANAKRTRDWALKTGRRIDEFERK